MNAYRAIAVLFTLITVGVDVWAIVTVARSPSLKYKTLWIIGSLFGFVGLGINWTKGDDILLEFVIQVPFISIVYFGQAREVAAKIMFPIIAIIALIRSRAEAQQSLFVLSNLGEAE